jgi:phage gp36-like protein
MYCTEADLYLQFNKSSLVEFAKDEADTGEEYITRISDTITAAEAEINGYLAKQCKVPLVAVPAAVKNVCVDITIYKIICRKGIQKEGPDGIWLDRYKSAIKFLEGVRDGVNDIGIVSALGASTPSVYEYQSDKRIFDKKFWEGF